MAQEAAKTKTVTYKGVEYTVPEYVLDDLDALEAFEDSKFATFVRTVLGREQYAKFRKTSGTSEELSEITLVLLGHEESDEE